MSEILERVIEEFSKISAIPRPSKQELQVAAYLVERLKGLGAEVQIDSAGNVIGDVPASKGLEGLPIVAMQAHMDMVCVSDGLEKYNPLQDGIKLKREGAYLRAEGTSLGADDGIGIAIIIYILEKVKVHGRWRIIFTVDEESGMSGARGLNPEHLEDVTYLINVDSENAEELVLGSAGSAHVEYVRKLEWVAPTKQEGYKIIVRNLKGGHSGEAIGKKRANAIKILNEVLKRMECEISAVSGGSALNAIPSTAQAIIVVGEAEQAEGKEKPRRQLEKVCLEVEQEARAKYGEPELSIAVRGLKRPKRVMRKEDSKAIVELIDKLKSGVFKIREKNRTSANLGFLKNTDSAAYVYYMPRFHSENGYQNIVKHMNEAYVASRFDEINVSNYSQAWASEHNELAQTMLEVAQSQGRKLKQRVIHGGLECSHFIEKNSELQIVSIGTTNLDIHSPAERLLLSSVEPTVTLIMGTLERISKR